MTDSTAAPNPAEPGNSLHDLLAPAQEMVACWASSDFEGLEELWTEDADLVAADGSHLVGRQEIGRYMERLRAGPLKNSRIVSVPKRARTVGDGVAIVQLTSGLVLAGETQVRPDRRVLQTFVLVQADGRWLIDACQITRIIENGFGV